jgi:hypothetical protein
MATNDIERRRDARARITIPAEVIRRSERRPVQMVDASYRGIFLRMTEAPSVRELIKLRIALPTRELFAHAVVVRQTEEPGGRRGVGLRFFALNGQDRTDWEAFVTAALNARAHAA